MASDGMVEKDQGESKLVLHREVAVLSLRVGQKLMDIGDQINHLEWEYHCLHLGDLSACAYSS